MRDSKGGSVRKRKVGKRGLRHLKNECYEGTEHRSDGYEG